MQTNSCPPIPPELLEWLNAQYPEFCPNPDDAERIVWMKAGARQAVRHLNRVFEEQNDNIMEDDILNVYENT